MTQNILSHRSAQSCILVLLLPSPCAKENDAVVSCNMPYCSTSAVSGMYLHVSFTQRSLDKTVVVARTSNVRGSVQISYRLQYVIACGYVLAAAGVVPERKLGVYIFPPLMLTVPGCGLYITFHRKGSIQCCSKESSG